jgi:hypothetical protein
MRTILIILLLSINVLMADYKIFTNKSEPYSDLQVQQKEIIFFGEYEEYTKSLEEIQKNIAAYGVVGIANGLSNQSANLAKGLIGEGLNAGATGLGIGLLVGALDPYIMSLYADQYYIKVYKITLKNGKTVFMNKFLVGDKNPKLSNKKVDNILGDKQ